MMSSSASQPHMADTATLQKKVARYKQQFRILLALAFAVPLLVAVYIILWNTGSKNAYEALGKDIRQGPALATDSSGRLIVFSGIHTKDSTTGIWVSNDSGRYFKSYGGWKMDYYDTIRGIQVAPDNQTILAYSYYSFFIKPANTDSFSLFHIKRLPEYAPDDLVSFVGEPVFIPGTTDVLLYTQKYVYRLNYQRHDTIAVAKPVIEGFIANMAAAADGSFHLINEAIGTTRYYPDIKLVFTKFYPTAAISHATPATPPVNNTDNAVADTVTGSGGVKR